MLERAWREDVTQQHGPKEIVAPLLVSRFRPPFLQLIKAPSELLPIPMPFEQRHNSFSFDVDDLSDRTIGEIIYDERKGVVPLLERHRYWEQLARCLDQLEKRGTES